MTKAINKNKYGLFDKAVRSPEKERGVLSMGDITRQINAKAFTLTLSEAVSEGFINPYDEQDTVVIEVRNEI